MLGQTRQYTATEGQAPRLPICDLYEVCPFTSNTLWHIALRVKGESTFCGYEIKIRLAFGE